MSLGYKKLSIPEIQLFLNDIHDNINNNDSNNFEKIIKILLYLTNNLINENEPEVLKKTFDTIETLLNKKKFLLNIELSSHDIKKILGGSNNNNNNSNTNNTNNIKSMSNSNVLYEWLIFHNLSWLSNKSEAINNLVKGFIISIVNLIFDNLNNISYKSRLKSNLMTTLSSLIDHLFTSFQDDPKSSINLLLSVHFLTIMNDYVIANKLFVNKSTIQSCQKKLWLILNSDVFQDKSLVDNLKSLVILNQSNNICLETAVNINQITLFLDWIAASLNHHLIYFKSLSNSIIIGLLKLANVCKKKECVYVLSYLNVDYFLNSQLPAPVLKTLKILKLIISNTSEDIPRFNNTDFDSLTYALFHDDLPLLTYLNNIFDGLNDLGGWLLHNIKHAKNHETFNDPALLYTFISAVGNFPCLVSNDFNFQVNECKACGSYPMSKNHYNQISISRPCVSDDSMVLQYYEEIILNILIGKYQSLIFDDPLLCTNFMMTLFKLFASYRPPSKVYGDSDPLFGFVIRNLKENINRDVRLLCTRILPLFLISEKNTLMELKFTEIFSELSSLDFSNDSGNIYLAESTIKAFAELAIIAKGDWLNALILRLIDLFGEYNDHHVNLVFSSFLHISNAKSLSPYKLLSPYLPVVAVRLVKAPRTLNKVIELLGVSKKYFLNRTREYTTPNLLDYYKYDYIQEIANAANVSKDDLIFKQLPRILATYLCKDDTINERYILNVLSNASYEFKARRMIELFSRVGEITWFILLQINYDDISGKMMNKEHVFNALEYTAKVNIHMTGNISKRQYKNFEQMDFIKYLLGDHILELVQRFSESINQVTKPYYERILSLKAIEFLITTNVSATASALGQISTSLQATIEDKEFEYPAMKCLDVLILNLSDEHLISLFDIVISLVFQRFDNFEERSKLLAVEILRVLFLQLNASNNRYYLYYYSVVSIPTLTDYYKLDPGFKNMIRPKSKIGYFPEFTRRLKTLNKYVVKQALDDLINYTTAYQDICQLEDFKDPLYEGRISELIRTLLDTSYKFKNENTEISIACAKALSRVGALDPSKFNLKAIKTQLILIHDFNNYDENAQFLSEFIQNILIVTFWASNNPIKQMYYSYALQQFLKVMRLDISVLSPTGDDIFCKVWNDFTDITKSTLTPFLSSRFYCQVPKYIPVIFPLFKTGMSYDSWLVGITTELLQGRRSDPQKDFDNPTKEVLFTAFASLVRNGDTSICHHLLKHLALGYIVNGDETAFENLKIEFLHILNFDANTTSPDGAENIKACYHTIFEVLDYFHDWISSVIQYLNEGLFSKQELNRFQQKLKSVSIFLDSIPLDIMVVKSAECDSYERTILYLEKSYRRGNVDETNKVGGINIATTLQLMYSNINDLDALDGVLKVFSTKNLDQKLSVFQYNDNWSIAQEAFHVLNEVGTSTENIDHQTSLLKSLSEHASYDEILSTISARIDTNDLCKIPLDWSMVGLQAAILSADQNKLRKWLFITQSIGNPQDVEGLINVRLAEGLKAEFEGKEGSFQKILEEIYKIIGSSLTSSLSSSSRNSNLMTQLHIGYDLSLLLSNSALTNVVTRAKNEDTVKFRIGNMDQTFESQWKVLSIHIVASIIRNNVEKTSQTLLACSEIARSNGRFDVSTASIMKAMVHDDENANFEYACLLWDQGKQTDAIKSLERIINEGSLNDTFQKAKIQFQYAEWLDESSHSSSSTIIGEYTKSYQLEPKWEKPYYSLGKYYDKLKESQDDPSGNYELQIIRHFLKALSLGPSFIFEALPKFITIWLDFAQRPKKTKEAEYKLRQIIRDTSDYSSNIPAYVWYTSITQIISRIIHPHDPSSTLLSDIVQRIIIAYPKHSLWFLLSHLNSNDPKRVKKISSILKNISLKEDLTQIVDGAQDLFSSLIKIANLKIKKGSSKRLSLKDDFGTGNLSQPCDSLVIPVRSNLEIRLPVTSHLKKESQAFPKSSAITFQSVNDSVNIFHSLQMPRQMTVIGSDGFIYYLMVKKDDTRKDAKVVEFTTMMNRLLNVSNEARKRNLSIANYSVVPLAENMGVLEFVKDVSTMKSIINEERKKVGQVINDRKYFIKLDEGQKILKSKPVSHKEEAKNDLVKLFELMLQRSPPVLNTWFINQFSDPTSWYLARNSFIRSSAVMSIVGYIIGLGDRHCENILFFKKNGNVLHIDFDCLFEKGATLPTPEIVPFRLTHNMVDAMGISGLEGPFRITSEVTASLIRDNEASLMNILETLIYDPLLDWRNQQNPQEHLRKVRRKIRGLLDENEGLPMNVHGQVDILIQQSCSNERLSQMYGGWAPYI